MTILRFGFVFLFLWFASEQIINTDMWTGLIPEWVVTMSGISAYTFVQLNAIFEVAGALFLAINVWTPVVAFLLSLHVFSIAYVLGWNPIGIRDASIALSLLALAMLSRRG